MITLNQIEQAFKSRDIPYEEHLSGMSKSAYFEFNDKNDNLIKIRISNHDLPASYNDKMHISNMDFRYTDSMKDVSSYIQNITGKKRIIKKKEIKKLTNETIEFLQKEAKILGLTFERIKSIYNLEDWI